MNHWNRDLDRLQRSGIRRFTNMAKEVPGCVMLTIGEPDFDTPEPICQAAAQALKEGHTHYAPNQGDPELLQAIADFESARGMTCEPGQVLVTVGATGALYTALTGVLEPGDQVIVPSPAFSLYESVATAAGAETVRLDLSETGLQIDYAALAAAIGPRTRAIVLNSPCNPTGTVLSEESLAAVKEAVLGKPIWVICDNVYAGVCDGPCPDLTLDPRLRDQVLLCQSFSKPYAMTGWRLGYLIGPQALMDRLLLLHAAQVASVPTFVQKAGVAALRTDVSAMAAEYRRRRDWCMARLERMGLPFIRPQGAFYIFLDIRALPVSAEAFCTRAIREAGVALVPGTCFGAEGFVRLSYCCSPSALEAGMARLETFLFSL